MRLIASLITLLLLSPLVAQRVNPDLVRPGPKGIFVFTGEQLMREGGPLTGIRIERRSGEQGEFKKVAELKPVGSAKDIGKGIEKAATVLPYPIDLYGQKPDSIWQRLQRYGTREQLGIGASNMAVLLALGAVWCDADVKPGTLYQYRVGLIGAENQLLSRFINPSETVIVDRLAPINATYYEHQKNLNLFWAATGDRRPAIVEVQRSMDKEPFAVIKPVVRVERRQGDSIWYQFTDTTAMRHRVFRYAVKGWDLTGNAMPACDTLYAASLDATQMPMPYDLHATGDSTGHRINVRWKLNNAPLVKQISLQRSTNSVDGFTTVAELSADRMSFVDEDVRPATSYFYRFVLEYKATHVPMRGVSFAAVAYDPSAPVPPLDLTAEATTSGIRLSWTHPDLAVQGFQLFRGEGQGTLMLASPLIAPAKDGAHSYLDTASTIRAGQVYRYTMRTISTSHIEGVFGDTVAVMPRTNAPMPLAPRDLTAQVDGDVAIVRWEDQSTEALWLGYRVVRARTGNRVDTLWRTTNFLIDTLDATGKPTTYKVIARNALGTSSLPSPAATAKAHVAIPSAPGGLEARTVAGKVELAWEPPVSESVARYDVYRYTRGSEPVKVGSVASGKLMKLEDANAVRGQLNFYFVRSVAASGSESGPSREAGVQF